MCGPGILNGQNVKYEYLTMRTLHNIFRKFLFDRSQSPTRFFFYDKSSIIGLYRPLTSILCLDIQICWKVSFGTLQIPWMVPFCGINVATPFSSKAGLWSSLNTCSIFSVAVILKARAAVCNSWLRNLHKQDCCIISVREKIIDYEEKESVS